MGTFGRFLKIVSDEIAPKKDDALSTNPSFDDTPDSVQKSHVNGKESKMLKLGSHNEQEAGFEHSSGSGDGRSNTGTGTLIGEHIAIEGVIRADEDIVIEGTVKGTIEVKSHQLTVGPKGKVEADVEAESVVISGRMVGSVVARGKVQISKNADFSGQIKAKRIAVEDGAFIKASIELERDAKEQPSLQKPIEATVFGSGDVKVPRLENPKLQTVK